MATLCQSYRNILEKPDIVEEEEPPKDAPKKKKKGLGILKKKAKKKAVKAKTSKALGDSIFTRDMSGSGSEDDLRTITETMRSLLADSTSKSLLADKAILLLYLLWRQYGVSYTVKTQQCWQDT